MIVSRVTTITQLCYHRISPGGFPFVISLLHKLRKKKILWSGYHDRRSPYHRNRRRDHQYAKAREAYAKYDAFGDAVRMIFPWKDSSGQSFSEEYNRVQREIAELEEKFGIEV